MPEPTVHIDFVRPAEALSTDFGNVYSTSTTFVSAILFFQTLLQREVPNSNFGLQARANIHVSPATSLQQRLIRQHHATLKSIDAVYAGCSLTSQTTENHLHHQPSWARFAFCSTLSSAPSPSF